MEHILPAEVWFPVVTLIIGVVLKGFYDSLADRRIARRERDARIETRRDARLLRRAEFQRETILALQEQLAKLTRATGKMHHADIMEFRKTRVWGKGQFPDDANNNAFEATTQISVLRVRIDDDGVRDTASKFTSACASVALARSEDEAEARLRFAIGMLEELSEQIGEVLRNLERIEEDGLAV
ncbi:hypothetical protein [Ciceribacter sp. T2.26MG-112.2]|uniref:hypothetical protein n=1 Tax=Ciceribacter sp. T2.26MG-112.2 TaxID=3137154 RepID=UPI0012B68702|nr:hypothetical protein [Ciceribacter naphthalenivorans]